MTTELDLLAISGYPCSCGGELSICLCKLSQQIEVTMHVSALWFTGLVYVAH